MNGDDRYEKGLRGLPKCCRDDLDGYFRHHRLPAHNPDLVALLSGEQTIKPSPHIRDILRAHYFLGLYAPDHAWGTPELVALWIARGILNVA